MSTGKVAIIVVGDDAHLGLEYALKGIVPHVRKGLIKARLDPLVFVFPEHAVRKEDITHLAKAYEFDGMCMVGGADNGLPELLVAAHALAISVLFVPYGLKNEKQEGVGLAPEMGVAQACAIAIEALGLSVPFSALCPAGSSEEADLAYKAGRLMGGLVESEVNFNSLATLRALENAAKVLKACNADLPELKDTLETLGWKKHKYKVPILLDCAPAGQFPLNYFWWAGGTMLIASELDDILSLGEMTVTGQSLGEIIKEYRSSKNFNEESKYLRKRGLVSQDIIHPEIMALDAQERDDEHDEGDT